jgi:hypothetical protein
MKENVVLYSAVGDEFARYEIDVDAATLSLQREAPRLCRGTATV